MLRELIRLNTVFYMFFGFQILFSSHCVFASSYYISSSEGNDLNNGLSSQFPFESIEMLNSMVFSPGDSIYFKSGDYWEGMFWLKGSGTSMEPIVVDVYGGSDKPVINGFGYQACILLYNDDHIVINGIELYNSFSHLDAGVSTIDEQTPELFESGPNTTWTNVFVACEIGDGNNGAQQTLTINVTQLPAVGANYRVVKTQANGNWYNAPAQNLSLGMNTITVNPVAFDRTVKIQFGNGAVEFDALSLNGTGIPIGTIKKLAGYEGVGNSWGSGKNVRFGVKVVASTKSLEDFTFNDLYIHDIYPTPDNIANVHLGYGIKLETQSDTDIGLFNIISNTRILNSTITETGHYGLWIKRLGVNAIDTLKVNEVLVENCLFEHTGGSGFVPNRSENVLVQNCTFNHSGSGIDSRMWNRGSGMWTFKCKNVVAQHNNFLNCHGPQDSYSCHIDYGNENVVFQYNYSYNNEGGFAEILGDNINCGYRYNISVNDGYREDPDGIPWNKKGKIFWISNFCGQNPIRCPSVGTFIYNNTVYVNENLNPEIYFWPDVGDVYVYNNLVHVGQSGAILPTFIQNESNILDISHNLFFDSDRIDLDSDLLNNAIFSEPNLLNTDPMGSNDASMYQLHSTSPAIGAGRLIHGSTDTLDYLLNNGGQDYFGNPVSDLLPPNIGAFNGGAATTPDPPDLVITEIMYNPPESGADTLEFIEIYNNGTSIVNLTGFTFSQGVTHTFAGGSIEPEAYFVVASNANAFLNTFDSSPDAEWSSGALSNGGEAIVLIDAFGQEVDAVNYDDSGSWPSGSSAGMPDGGGSSIVICDPAVNNNDGANWLSCSSSMGININGFEILASPGSENIIISTDIVSACDAYTWIDGVSYSSVNYNVPTSIDAQTPSLFQIGQNSPWDNIYTACVVGDGNNGVEQELEINITDLPAGANYRVLKTVANGNWFIGNPQPLLLGINTITVNAVAFDRAVKFQFDNGSVEFDELSVNETTIYSSIPSQVLSNEIGCDSIVTLDLSLGNSTVGIHNVEACDTYTWIDGNTYVESNNEANIMLSTSQGCDSLVTLDLTINNSYNTIDMQGACDNFTWIDGNTYSSSNNSASVMLTSIYGCDSLVTLDLTIDNSLTGTDDIDACDAYTWIDGVTYTESNNTATQLLTAVGGCDSTVTLNLTLNNSSSGFDIVEACDAYTWIDGVEYTESNNSATFVLQNTEGCDSTINLDLTITSFNVGVEVIDDITLEAETDVTGVSYQWVDCNDNFTPILEENNATFTTGISGEYGVQVTFNDCMVMSDCFTIINTVDIDEMNESYDIQLFPNPTYSFLNIALQGVESVDVELMDLQGKVLLKQKGLLNHDRISLLNLTPGSYFIKIYTPRGDRKVSVIIL